MSATTLSKDDCLQMLERYKKEYKKLEARCHKLERIHRERSNAERGLRPKKEHCGYVPLKSVVYATKYKPEAHITADDVLLGVAWKKMPKMKTILAFKITYQTPYTDTVPYVDVVDMVVEFFRNGVQDLGIDGINLTPKYERYMDDTGKELNMIWKIELLANHVKGYWEVVILTTKAIDGLPAGAVTDSEEDEPYEYKE